MSDKPIIFSAPMIQALLDGRKTQTRRVLKPQPPSVEAVRNLAGIDYQWFSNEQGCRPVGPIWAIRQLAGDKAARPAPFAPDDRLWVRETWRARDVWDDDSPRHIHHSEPIQYEATDPKRNGRQLSGRKRPSIHMPRWASRLTLTVTDVRVQRLWEISEADAEAEGVSPAPGGWWSGTEGQASPTRMGAFALLWNSLHGPDAWDANPWVAALTFDVHRCNIDQMEKDHAP